MTDQNNGGNAVAPKDDYVLASEQPSDSPNEAEVLAQDAGETKNPDTQDEQPKQKKLGGYQRRIQNLSSENLTVKQENAMLKAQLEQFNKSQGKPEQPPEKPASAQKANGEPDINEYSDVIEYLKAHQKWETANTLKAHEETKAKTAQEQAATQEYEAKQDDFNGRVETLLEKVPDFYERAASLYQQGLISEGMEKAVLDSPVGEMIALYYMANPQELQGMQGMSEPQIYRQIALLEAKIVSGQQSPVGVGKQTKAAAPINPVKPSAGIQKTLSDDMPFDEWVKLRRDGLRR